MLASCSLLPLRPMLAKQKLPLTSSSADTSLVYIRVLSRPPQRSLHTCRATPPASLRCPQTNVSTSRPHGSSSSSLQSNTSSTHNQCRFPELLPYLQTLQHHRHASSSSKWVSRQSSDQFSREAKLQNFKSRAAFKLLQLNEKHRLFRPGMTVVDLGYAPGSWSQVAIDLVRPGLGRVVGVDVIPVQPPKGVSGIQGDFLSRDVQDRVREFLSDEGRGKLRRSLGEDNPLEEAGYLDRERAATSAGESSDDSTSGSGSGSSDSEAEHEGKVVDIVLSDMSAPWEMNLSTWKNSISNPYRRMMNTTGNKFRDHAGSMDLCRSALYFSYETLKIGGHFVCKFYQGAEDRRFEQQLKAMFHKVHREKPESSRSESREGFFVAVKRLARVERAKVFDEG